MVKGKKRSMPSYDKWVPKAIHYNTVTAKELTDEICNYCSATPPDVILVTEALIEIVKRHLQDGDKVEIPAFGTFKLEIDGKCADTPDDFSPTKHINGVKIHFIPKSSHGKQSLYDGIELKREDH